jgi:AcrR family transcriptional regulator
MRPTKREELVRKALASFYRNGFQATGMDMIVEQSGISKTSIYNHFKTKEDLILAVLRLRDETFRNWLYRRMEALASDPKGQLLAMFDALGEWFQEVDFKGCMFIKASSEYQDQSHPIHKQSAEHKRIIEAHLGNLVAAAGYSNPVFVARQLMVLKEGATVTAQLSSRAEAANDARQAAEVILLYAQKD